MPRLLQLNLLVLLWSLTGILGEFLTLAPAALVFWRTAITSVLYFFYCLIRKPSNLRLSARHLRLSLLSGFILGVHWICFFGAIAVSNISIGLAGFAATSLFASFLEPLMEKKRPELGKVLLSLLVALGICLIAGARTNVPNSGLGLAIALVGAFLAAIYSLMSKSLITEKVPGATLMTYQMPGSNLAALLAMLLIPAFPLQVPQATDWLPLLFLAIACTFIAYLWFAKLLEHLTAYTVNLAINFEPVYGMLMAAAFFHEYESLTPLFYLGSATIVLANVLHARQPQ